MVATILKQIIFSYYNDFCKPVDFSLSVSISLSSWRFSASGEKICFNKKGSLISQYPITVFLVISG